MKKVLLFVLWFSAINCFSQAPFSTYKKPTLESAITKHRIKNNDLENTNISRSDSTILINKVNKQVEENNLDRADFLEHINANLISIQDGKKLFPTINGEVINYKLGLWTTTKPDRTKRTHYLPISLISKVSGNYSDSSAGATDDATSYFGAPLTFRFSPAFELTKLSSTENKLFLGFNTDLRLLTIGDTIKNKVTTSWGAYGSFGITYMGKGFAEQRSDNETSRIDGKWSFSALLYFFKGGGTFNKAVLGDYEKKTLSGIEMLLRFKTNKKEDSKFNFLIGASNGFTRGAPNFAKWEFRIGIGK
jgi:hypothetical protein